jgi:hypothetical protein
LKQGNSVEYLNEIALQDIPDDVSELYRKMLLRRRKTQQEKEEKEEEQNKKEEQDKKEKEEFDREIKLRQAIYDTYDM